LRYVKRDLKTIDSLFAKNPEGLSKKHSQALSTTKGDV
jgi:hypothetical protein